MLQPAVPPAVPAASQLLYHQPPSCCSTSCTSCHPAAVPAASQLLVQLLVQLLLNCCTSPTQLLYQLMPSCCTSPTKLLYPLMPSCCTSKYPATEPVTTQLFYELLLGWIADFYHTCSMPIYYNWLMLSHSFACLNVEQSIV